MLTYQNIYIMPWGTNYPTTVQSNSGNGYQSPTILYRVLLKSFHFMSGLGRRKESTILAIFTQNLASAIVS